MMSFLLSPLTSIQFLQYQIAGHILLQSRTSLFLGSFHWKHYKSIHPLKAEICMALTSEGLKTCQRITDVFRYTDHRAAQTVPEQQHSHVP